VVAELRDRLADVIREFPFDNYGLDDVSYLLEDTPDTQEWVPALASAILPLVQHLEAEAAAARKYADEMRGFCSPHGVSVHYAEQLVETMDRAKEGPA
jgi:predicted NACHT family NTPase